jgi:hypothetical protein
MFRYIDANNFMMFVATSSGYKLYRVTGGTSNQLTANAGPVPVAGDILTVVFSGDSISARVNGTEYINTTDSQGNTATKHGVCTRAYTGALFDNFTFEG